MPCHHPLQATYSLRPDGKRNVLFSNVNAELFVSGQPIWGDTAFSIPCGRCMGCRLERSRQWAVRCMHEAELYEDNCFLTLTFNDEKLKEMCPSGSLDRKHVQNFLKRVRQRFDDRRIRTFYCGEYGDKLGRPHYHVILFNLAFHDRCYWKTVSGQHYYVSDVLSSLWSFGHSVIGDVTFESAAYVARYCTKKVTGDKADEHYCGRLPEFSQASLKPGLARGWIDKYGMSDVYPFDEVVVRGVKCKPPRYYDKVLEKVDPLRFAKMRERRVVRADSKVDDNTHARLLVKEKCLESRFKKLVRTLESQ